MANAPSDGPEDTSTGSDGREGTTHDGTVPIRPEEGVDVASLQDYLRRHVTNLPPGRPEVRQFPAGASNLTYLVRIGDWAGVLRRPPLGPLPPKAHDMMREAWILQQLHAAYPLAPRPDIVCADLDPLGAPFYIMEYRPGLTLDASFPRDIIPTRELCGRISTAVVDTLVQLHTVDWRVAGLAKIGHPEGFLERQVRGWIGRYEQAQTDDIGAVAPLMRWLEGHIPPRQTPTIIHNDFKLNNLLLDRADPTQVVAVLDWEMATIGDPLFDLAVALSYWGEPDDPPGLRAALSTVTTQPGFISRREFMGLYAARSGRDLSAMPFYLTFAYFKWAVIIQQIYVRWVRGQTRDARFSHFGPRVHSLIEHAHALAQGSGP